MQPFLSLQKTLLLIKFCAKFVIPLFCPKFACKENYISLHILKFKFLTDWLTEGLTASLFRQPSCRLVKWTFFVFHSRRRRPKSVHLVLLGSRGL